MPTLQPTTINELAESYNLPRWSGFWGVRFLGTVGGLANDLLLEGAAAAVGAAFLQDFAPGSYFYDQPLDALARLGQDSRLPFYATLTPPAQRARLRARWDFWAGAPQAGLLSELAAAGITATLTVPGDLGAIPTSDAPEFVAVGANAEGAGAISVPWPAGHVVGQLGLLFVHSRHETVATPAGWNLLVNNGGGGVGTTGAALWVFFRFAISGAEANAAVADSGTYTRGLILTFSDVLGFGQTLTTAIGAPQEMMFWPSTVAPDGNEAGQGALCVIAAAYQAADVAAVTTTIAGLAERTDGFGSAAHAIYVGTGKAPSGPALTSASTFVSGGAGRFALASIILIRSSYWSRFWLDITGSPLTGPGLSWGAHRVGLDILGPAGGTAEYFGQLREIVGRTKPAQWIPWEYRWPGVAGGTIRIQGTDRPLDPGYVYFS